MLIESAKINGLDPAGYVRTAAPAALRGEAIPPPHEPGGAWFKCTHGNDVHLGLHLHCWSYDRSRLNICAVTRIVAGYLLLEGA